MTKNRILTLSLMAACLALVCATLLTSHASASPAAPVQYILTQPDGSTFIAHTWGDEWNNGIETIEGYSVLRMANGWWAYAEPQEDGTLAPAMDGTRPMLVGVQSPAGLVPHARPGSLQSSPRWAGSSQENLPGRESPRAPTAGAMKTLVLLASFNDRSETYSAASFQELVFSTGASSLRNYFREVSYDIVDIQPAAESCGTANDGITDWTNLGYNHPNTGTYVDSRNQWIVKNVLTANDGCINFSTFDSNGDGYIGSNELLIMVVVAGFEKSYFITDTPSVWAHQWALDDIIPPTLDGKVVGNSAYGGYAQVGEVHADHQATIGILAHEIGNLLNWPDLYDYSGSSSGVGVWSLMGTGSWNGITQAGDSPAHPDAWLKWYQGWLVPTPVVLTMSDVAIAEAEDNPVAFLLRLNPGGVDWKLGAHSGTGEYFLVENRQQTLYDSGLPGCGLLIWHVDESVADHKDANGNRDHPLIALEQADGGNHLYSGVNTGDILDPWPSGYHFDFGQYSDPNSNLYTGFASSVSLRVTDSCSPSMIAKTLRYAPLAPGDFSKLSPANGATGLSTRIPLDWADASEAASYAFCYDDLSSGDCAGSWTSTGPISSATLAGLTTNKTYRWQARAINTGGTTDANGGTFRTFTTGSIDYSSPNFLSQVTAPVGRPSAFGKLYPLNSATGISINPTIDWADTEGAFSYNFCYDLTLDGECTGGWTSTGTTSQIKLSGLPFNTTYEWQARAVNSGGTTYADDGTEWSFTTIPLQATWVTVTSEDFETTIPKPGWSRYDKSISDNGEYFIGRTNCVVYNGSYSGWLVGAGAQGGALGCGASYVANLNTWFIYGPFSTQNATAGQVNYRYYLNSASDMDRLWVMATDDYTGDSWWGHYLTGQYTGWPADSLNLAAPLCKNGTVPCTGLPEVYIAFTFVSDGSSEAAYGAIIDDVVLRICNASSCTSAPPFGESSPNLDEIFRDFTQPFLQQFDAFITRRLPPGLFDQ